MRRQRGLSELSPEVGSECWGTGLADSRTLLMSRRHAHLSRQQWRTFNDCQICNSEPCTGWLSIKGRRWLQGSSQQPAACILESRTSLAPVWPVPRVPGTLGRPLVWIPAVCRCLDGWTVLAS